MRTSRYDAFLSYSHEDAALAERISRRIRNYRPPRAARLGRKKLEVFRDRERLTANPDLGKLLADTVSTSEHLVLLASPASALSPYVNQEVATFIDQKGISGISVVACAGELPDILPPALRARVREPLYIDLRQPGRRTFRLETLRLIAALLGVDYSELRREDDLRRLRRRAIGVAATLALAAGLGSAYLVQTTPAEAWEQLTQPSINAGRDPLMPIERVAINSQDPSVVVWLGDNARYQRDLARARETWALPEDELGDIAGHLKAPIKPTNLDAANQPLASIALEASSGRDAMGSGELQIYAVFEKDTFRFARTFRFAPSNPSRQTIVLPLTLLEDGRSPFDLEPSPASALRRAGFDSMTLFGIVTDRSTGDRSDRLEFIVSDNRAEIREVLDATAGPEHVIASTSETQQAELRDRLEASGAEDLWSEIMTDSAWVTFRPPDRTKPSTFSRKSSDVREDAKGHVDPSLAAVLDTQTLAGDFVEFEQVSRSIGDTTVAVATLAGILDSHEAVAAPRRTHYFHSPLSQHWVSIRLPLESTLTRIVDVVPVQSNLRMSMIVTDSEGVFRSIDGGESWQSTTFGEPRLQSGELLRVMVSGSSFFALVNAHHQPGEDPNPLLRLVRRNWIRRWRLGMARLLEGPKS